VTIHSLRTPSISLHAAGHAESAVLATAQYNFLSATDIEILARPWNPSQIREELVKTGWLPDAWTFEMLVPRSGRREKFEWKYSRGAGVAALDGKIRGLKCVRVATGEVVCVWAWSVGLKKAGKFR
jgi:hypothetical protein